jgi:hypothetical protein
MSDLDDIELTRPNGAAAFTLKTGERGKSQRPTRGKKHLLLISKRPRKNARKRFEEEIKPLRAIGEDEEVLSHGSLDSQYSHYDQYRAPKAALGIFLFICSVGSYQLFLDYWSAKAFSSQRVDVSNMFPSTANSSDTRQKTIQSYLAIADIPITISNGTVTVPIELDNLANVFHEEYNSTMNKLFLWHIPRSGSTTIKQIAANCLGLTLASEVGKSEVEVRGAEDSLKIIEGADGMHFANVDMSYLEGIARAKALNVGTDPRIDLVSSAYLFHTAGIFNPEHKGFMFAMMRHPIERAVSLFYNMRRYPQFAKVIGPIETVEMYARSSLAENNWMTRFLSNTLAGKLLPEHEAIAKEVLRTKCIVGLLSEKTESMRRFELFFNTKAERSQRRDDCTGAYSFYLMPVDSSDLISHITYFLRETVVLELARKK